MEVVWILSQKGFLNVQLKKVTHFEDSIIKEDIQLLRNIITVQSFSFSKEKVQTLMLNGILVSGYQKLSRSCSSETKKVNFCSYFY